MSTEPETTEQNDDSNRYIRTYATDFAVLAEKDPEGASHVKDKVPKIIRTKPAPVVEHVKSSKGRIDNPPVVAADPNAISKIDLDTAQVTNEHPQEIPASSTQGEGKPEITELPKIEAGDIVNKESDADRAAILSRLKAHAATLSSAETPKQPAPPPVPEKQIPLPQIPPSRSAELSPIHTYTSDFADRIDEKNASTFSVLAAEKDAPVKKNVPKKQSNKKMSLVPIVLGVILLILGGGGIYVAYMYMNRSAPVAVMPIQSSLIPFESKAQLTGTGSDLLKAFAGKASEPLTINSVLLVYTNESTTTAQGTMDEQGTGGDFINQLNLDAPDILLRNIDPSSMVGIENDGDETRPFFILRVLSYERTFAGMLQWESTMQRDLSTLYPLYPQALAPVVNATSTATSTKIFIPANSTQSVSAVMPQFTDEIVSNRSVRALKDTSGHTVVLYGYVDKATLIIARNEAAFTFLVGRLASSAS